MHTPSLPQVLANSSRDGIPFPYERYHDRRNKDIRWLQSFQNLERAFQEFTSACAEALFQTRRERSGLIQTFEFTYKLPWKTLQDLLLSRGYEGILGPRPVREQAFQDGIIEDGETWAEMSKIHPILQYTLIRKKWQKSWLVSLKQSITPRSLN